MVNVCFYLVAQMAEAPLQGLAPLERFRLVAALVLLALGGVALVVLAWMVLRVGRRSSQREDLRVQRLQERNDPDDWAREVTNQSNRTDRDRKS